MCFVNFNEFYNKYNNYKYEKIIKIIDRKETTKVYCFVGIKKTIRR